MAAPTLPRVTLNIMVFTIKLRMRLDNLGCMQIHRTVTVINRIKVTISSTIRYLQSSGGTNVSIENLATAGLYNYTPYQPNQSALNNLYGSGDSCGAYGNRNFWRLFNDWFGPTSVACRPGAPILPQVRRLYNPRTYEHFYTALQCEVDVLTQKHGFQLLGYAYNTTPADSPISVPLYRLYNAKRQLHFWTTSQAESNAVQQQLGYSPEGVAFYVAAGTGSTYPVYRLYNPATEVHFWTLSLSEADSAARYGGYRFEGTVFYSQ